MARAAASSRIVKRGQPTLMDKMREYVLNRAAIKRMTERNKELNSEIMDEIGEKGEVDSDGNFLLPMAQEVEGITAMQKQRRVSKKVDPKAAERVLREAGWYERCYPPVPTLDESEIWKLFYSGELNDDQIEEMFPTKVTWALVPKK